MTLVNKAAASTLGKCRSNLEAGAGAWAPRLGVSGVFWCIFSRHPRPLHFLPLRVRAQESRSELLVPNILPIIRDTSWLEPETLGTNSEEQ